jgi:tRNA 2-thiouridine synthesizing protein A
MAFSRLRRNTCQSRQTELNVIPEGSEMRPDHDHEIDTRGLQCPLPVLKARKRLNSIKPGESLKILATDPAATIDFPHYCNESGNELIWSGKDDNDLVFIIRKTHAK